MSKIWEEIEALMIEQRELRTLYDSSATGIYDEPMIDGILSRLLRILTLLNRGDGLINVVCVRFIPKLKSVRSKLPVDKISAIDALIHEVHKSGMFAQHLIKGKDKEDIFNFLSELSAIRDPKQHDALIELINDSQQSLSVGVPGHALYGSIPFASLSRSNATAIRDTKERYAAMGIGVDVFNGHKVLDLGCNAGHMMFEAVSRGLPICFGLEKEDTHVRVGNQIAKYMGLEDHVKLICADVGVISREFLKKKTGIAQFDSVFCLAVDGYVVNPTRFYAALVDVTKDVCYFEPNNHKRTWNVDTVKALGFKGKITEVTVPYNTKEGSTRPAFICKKA